MNSQKQYTTGSTKNFSHLLPTIYSECLQTGCFAKKCKTAKIIPITKLGNENLKDVSKYRTISQIDVGGKGLEKILINRTMLHIYSNNILNQNQYGFTTRKSTKDVSLVVKDYIEEGLRRGQITILVSFGVRGGFDAA
jgi:hypothetical protein